MQSRRLIIRHVVVSLVFVGLYVLLNRPEVIFFSQLGVVAWYPAIGLVMALLLGVSPWYAFLACLSDAIASRLFYAQPSWTFTYTVASVGVPACYGCAAYVLRGPLQIDLGLPRRRDVFRYVFGSAAAAAAATTIGVTCLIADHSILSNDYKRAAIGWFLGDAIALVGIAPFLLVHVFPHIRSWLTLVSTRPRSTRSHLAARALSLGGFAEMFGQGLTILVLLWVMFGSKDGQYDHFYLCFIPVIWIAIRQGVRRVVIGILALNCGFVVAMHLSPPTPVLFAKVGLVMLVMSAVGLIVGSEVSERQHLAIELAAQTAYSEALVQNSPLGIVVLDRQGHIELTNPAFEKLFQYNHQELASIDLGAMEIPAEQSVDGAQLIRQIFGGHALHRTVRQRRKDGQVLDLALHGVPLMQDTEVRGAYLIYEDVSEQIRANETQLQLVKELELRTQQITALNEMAAFLECSATVNDACAVVAGSIVKLFPETSSGGLYLFRPSRNLIEEGVRWGEGDGPKPTFLPDACWSLRRGQPHWSLHPGTGISCSHLPSHSDTEFLCVPMVAQGNTLGVLSLGFQTKTNQSESVSESLRVCRQRLAFSATSQIALSLASLQLRESLREQSIRDPLTRLFNRRFLEESLERELQVASRKRQPLSLLFLDLDHFKRINDTFGHEAGDMVLKSLADLFRSFFRTTDICCRYGGEEFAIILPESSAQDAVIRADSLRAEIKKLDLNHDGQTLGILTLSAGVAAFPEHALSSVELLKMADQCLYESKAHGRDVVTVAVLEKA